MAWSCGVSVMAEILGASAPRPKTTCAPTCTVSISTRIMGVRQIGGWNTHAGTHHGAPGSDGVRPAADRRRHGRDPRLRRPLPRPRLHPRRAGGRPPGRRRLARRPLRRQGGGAQADRHRRRRRPARGRDHPRGRPPRGTPVRTRGHPGRGGGRGPDRRQPQPLRRPRTRGRRRHHHPTRETNQHDAVSDRHHPRAPRRARQAGRRRRLPVRHRRPLRRGHDVARVGHRDAGLRGRVGPRVPPADAQEEHLRLRRQHPRRAGRARGRRRVGARAA